MEDVGGRAGGPGARRAHHDRRLCPLGLRGHAGHRDRTADHPGLLALRHRRGVRQGPREHQEPQVQAHHLRRRGQPRGQPDAGALDQHLDRRAAAGGGHPLRRRHHAGRGRPEGPRALPVRRHGRGHVLLDLRRHAARGAAEVEREGRDRGRASREGAPAPRRRPLRQRPGVLRGHAHRRGAHRRRRRTLDDAERRGRAARRSGPRPPPRGHRLGPRRPRVEGTRHRVARLGASAAEPAAPLQAGPQVSASDTITRLVRDIADFPEPGVLFKDITPLLADAAGFAEVVEALAEPYRGQVDVVLGIEARGFILAAPVALALGVGFVPVRKPGKLPHETTEISYDLEYGSETLQLHTDAIGAGSRVLVVDDVLATGGTARAAVDLVERAGGTIAAVAVLMELSFLPGREVLGDVPLHVLHTF
ncbi:adenine phosphoribosyltransferase [Nocardioides mangrovicus]|uniref:Adenine phosphoribosyltransferase n=1 Tax=Nocardioides mangrovicus TaxID=2478913 RepID=A0A3L8P4B6_9ACTN|nr:adenine phosphoribosyltransferase [Nocardioides mangrovicus]